MIFKEMILKSMESSDTAKNLITDGTHQCTYHELIEIFVALDRTFGKSAVSPGDCSVLICGNSLPEAVLLLWMLYRKRNFLLLPRGGLVISLPEFCHHKIYVNLNSPGIDIKVPGTYLVIEANPGCRADASLPGEQGSILLKTSGSTAEPKLVMHSHESFAQNAINCVRRFEITPHDRLLIPVPIYHMYALGAAIIPGVIAGASINLLEKTNIIKYLDREKQYQPNVSFLTPPLCDMFLRARKSPYHYRLVVTAGDRITPVTFENFETKYGTLVNLYGSTELGAIATNKSDDPLTLRSNGILETMPGVTVDFTDKESENDPGRVSEIICSHDYGFDTYVDKKGQKITSETAKPFKTKDLGKRITANRFQVVGRTGNSVNRHGILVAFSEVESIIEQGIEEVAHAVVTGGKEDITRGKKMIAWCELKPQTKPDNQELRSQCFNIMLRHMVPDEVRIIKEIPRLPNGKFDRKKLAALKVIIKSFCRGGQMLHGGSFFKKRPPWPPEAKKGGNMSDTIVNQLKDIIANKLDVNLAYDEINENVSLFEDGLGLDSIAIVDLIVSIENTFSLSIEDEELNADLFKNLKILSEFVRNKLKN